jgi:archaellum component FlaC
MYKSSQAIKDVRASKDVLIDLFGRMEYFFKRLEAYIKVRPTAAMTDIIVKIMVEVISILGVVTKEVRQGRTSMLSPIDTSPKVDLPAEKYLKKLFGMKDIEDALQRLDKLTQEEARMAAAEGLTISRGIDDRVKVVDERLEGVDGRVQSVDVKVEGIEDQVQLVDNKVEGVDDRVRGVDDKVQGVDSKVQGVDNRLLSVDTKVQGVDDKVLSIDSKVQDVDHKVETVIEGDLSRTSWFPNLS